MCGIAGVLGTDPAGLTRERGLAMAAAIRHRGPDAFGVYQDGPAMLVHTRLSIIELSELGAQPMASADGRFVLSYNGEVYNFLQLRQALIAEGASFRSRSDTEVVLQALARWGVDALRRFNGMFALALWDRERRELLLARDRFGIKPLYYRHDGDTLVFGSEITALTAGTGAASARLDRQGLVEYLYFGCALGEQTLIEGCRKLLPGHWLRIRPGQAPDIAPYWTLAEVPSTHLTGEATVAAVREALEHAVTRHLIADVPVALFLSGGLDSSSLCALAAPRLSGALRTISVEFEGRSARSELASARLVAQRFGTRHEEHRLGYADLPRVLEQLTDVHGQPFGDPANVPLYLMTGDLGADTKVVLQGDGGDEIFGGYRRYELLDRVRRWQWFARMLPVPRGLAGRFDSARRLRRMQEAVGLARGAERFGRLLTDNWGSGEVAALLRADLLAGPMPDPFARYWQVWPAVAHLPPAQGMLWTDTQILLPDLFFEKVDRATMAHGVEVRVPFMDHELTDLVMGLDAHTKLAGGSKALLRAAMRDLLPAAILDGPKLGFGVPFAEWLGGPLAGYLREQLLAPDGLARTLFVGERLTHLIDRHTGTGYDHGILLYRLLVLSIWGERMRVTV